MESLLDSPFAPIGAACLAVALAFGLLARALRFAWPANLVAPLVFLTGYYLTYNKIPSFPPAGSTNKIFYVVIAAALLGLALDVLAERWASSRAGRIVVGAAASVAVVAWIGLPRLAGADADLWALIAALALGGALLLWRVASLGAPDGAFLLPALFIGFAPIALFGGSSTSVGLCIGLAVGLGALALLGLFAPRPLGWAAALGAGAGLLAMIDTVTLITRKTDLLALLVYPAALFAGQLGARLLPPQRIGPRLRAVLTGAMAAAPIVVVLAILLSRHDLPT